MEGQGPKKLSLANMADGAAVEAFDIQLRRVLENILDPNVNATAVRKVTLEVRIKPDENRSFGPLEFVCYPTFAKDNPVKTLIHIARNGKDVIASEHDTRQLSLPADSEEKPTPLRAVSGAGSQEEV